MRCLPVFVLVLALARSAGAAPTAPSVRQIDVPRVRPADARVATLLIDGLRRSPALVALVDRVEATDVIVYLEIEPTLAPRYAGCLTWVTTAGGYRYLRASLNPNLPADQMIAAIGHELQHAIEIADHPEVVDTRSLVAFYQRIAPSEKRHDDRRLDTHEARAAGTLVRNELRSARAPGAAGTGSISPRDWHVWYRQRLATRSSEFKSQNSQN